MIRSQPLAPYFAAVLVIVVIAQKYLTPRPQLRPTPQMLHAATAAIRDQQDAADGLVELKIAVNGMEADQAGFHLLRPVSDPLWQFGRLQPHYDHRWWDTRVRYRDVEVQRLLPVAEFPGFIEPVSAVVSQGRTFSNALGNAWAVADSWGGCKVMFTLPPEGVAAMQHVLRPTTTFPKSGEFADWYRTTLRDGAPSTPMLVAVVSDNVAYLPVVVQDVIAGASSAGASFVVADRLPAHEAIELAARLNATSR